MSRSKTAHLSSADGPTYRLIGELVTMKVTSEESGGAVSVWLDTIPPNVGPPPHTHQREDEWFYVLDGVFEFYREGQDPLRAGVGDLVYTPKGIAHTFRNVGARTGRMLTSSAPAGMDKFFAEVGQPAVYEPEPTAPEGPPDEAEIEHLVRTAAKYGIEIKLPSVAQG